MLQAQGSSLFGVGETSSSTSSSTAGGLIEGRDADPAVASPVDLVALDDGALGGMQTSSEKLQRLLISEAAYRLGHGQLDSVYGIRVSETAVRREGRLLVRMLVTLGPRLNLRLSIGGRSYGHERRFRVVVAYDMEYSPVGIQRWATQR